MKKRTLSILLCAAMLFGAIALAACKAEAPEEPAYITNVSGERVQKLTRDELAVVGEREIPFEVLTPPEDNSAWGGRYSYIVSTAYEAGCNMILDDMDIDYDRYSVIVLSVGFIPHDIETAGSEDDFSVTPVMLLEKDGYLVAVVETDAVPETYDGFGLVSDFPLGARYVPFYLLVEKKDLVGVDNPILFVSVYDYMTYGTDRDFTGSCYPSFPAVGVLDFPPKDRPRLSEAELAALGGELIPFYDGGSANDYNADCRIFRTKAEAESDTHISHHDAAFFDKYAVICATVEYNCESYAPVALYARDGQLRAVLKPEEKNTYDAEYENTYFYVNKRFLPELRTDEVIVEVLP